MRMPCYALATVLGFCLTATPASAADGLTLPDAAALTRLPLMRLPAAEVQQQLEQHKGEALRFAVAVPLSLDTRNGTWDAPDTSTARWRLHLGSDGARSLAAQLHDVVLPEGAQLWFYGDDGRDVQGPFTRDNPALIDGSLSLPVVRNDRAVLEVSLPLTQRSALALRLSTAYHGYRPFSAASARPKAAIGNESESCNINVVCTEGDAWRDQIRSVVLLTVGNQTLCTGTLLNNIREDDRPLVLTANHCDLRTGNVAQTTAYFNVQSSSCGGNDDGRVDQNLRGGSFLARDENTDFTLFTLTNTPAAAFNVYYAGWDARSGVVPQSGVTLHHPSGDEKKISVFSSPAVAVEDQRIGSFSDGFNVDSWQVNWTRGTTETGSSGSGLFNQNRQLVGVLSGGAASCDSPNQPDFFGRLERAWQADTASSGQLKVHLDPGNTGRLQLDGKNASNVSPPPTPPPSEPGPSNPPPATTPPATSSSGGGGLGFCLLAGLLLAACVRLSANHSCRAAAAA